MFVSAIKTISRTTFITASFVVIFTVTLSACSSNKSRVGSVLNLDTDIKIVFDVESDINPDETNKPSPLFIRMYELKSDTLFNKANFIDLYEQDEKILGADLVRKQELKRFAPGEDREEKFVADENTQYIALFAEFFQFKDSQYKIIFPVTVNNVFRNKTTVVVSSNKVELKK